MDKNIKVNQKSEGAKSRSSFDANIPANIRKEAEVEYKKQERKRKEAEKHFEELQAKRKKLLEQKIKLQERLTAEESVKLQESLKLKMLELEMKLKEIEDSIKEDEANNAEFLPKVEKAIQKPATTEIKPEIVVDEPKNNQEVVEKEVVEDSVAEANEPQTEEISSNNEKANEPIAEESVVESEKSPLEDVVKEEPQTEETTNQETEKVEPETNEVVSEAKEEVVIEPEKPVVANDGQTKTQKVSLDEIQKAKEEMNKEKVEKENASKKKKPSTFIDNLPPEESLADDLTDEELERYIQEEQAAQEKALLEEEQKAYEGMSEEEIKEAKTRKLKFLELQKRYNSRENVNPSDMGDYKKNLDFTINKNLKKFRVKPPKSLFKILVAVFTSLLVVGAVVAYIVVNKPPEPILLTSMRLSQTKTYQTVGENLDLRGLYLHCEYSDGTQKTIKASESLISKTSSNISANRRITGLYQSKETAFVYFALETIEVKLDITLTQFEVTGVSASLYLDKITAGDFISFEKLLLLGQTSDDRQLRIDPKTCSYKIAGNALTRTDEGIYIPQTIFGAQTLTIVSYHNGREYTSLINVYIEELIVEEPTQEPAQEQPVTE